MVNYWIKNPIQRLTSSYLNITGRNNSGFITFFHRGGGCKRRYRFIDFKRIFIDIPAVIVYYEKDPNRTALLCLIIYMSGILSYILAPKELTRNRIIISSLKSALTFPGNSMLLKYLPIGTHIHNLEINYKQGAKYIRAAGTSGQVLRKKGSMCMVRLASGEIIKVSSYCRATVGTLENSANRLRKFFTAGNYTFIKYTFLLYVVLL